MSIEQVAKSLTVSTKTVWRHVWSGDLESVKFGRRRLVSEHALSAYMNLRTNDNTIRMWKSKKVNVIPKRYLRWPVDNVDLRGNLEPVVKKELNQHPPAREDADAVIATMVGDFAAAMEESEKNEHALV
jgi:excisionase family DNA binding protein